MRWASPPESDPAGRCNVRYSRPTLTRKPRREVISFRMRSEMARWRALSGVFGPDNFCDQSSDLLIGHSVISKMFTSPTVTASASGRRRFPPQVGQGRSLMYSLILERIHSELVSR